MRDEGGEISAETAGPTFKEEEEPEEEPAADEDEENMTERRARAPPAGRTTTRTTPSASRRWEEQLKPLALERFATITDLYNTFSAVQAHLRRGAGRVGDDFPGCRGGALPVACASS